MSTKLFQESNTGRKTVLDKESLEALEGVNNIYDLKQLIAMTLSIPYNSIMLQDFTTDQGDDAT